MKNIFSFLIIVLFLFVTGLTQIFAQSTLEWGKAYVAGSEDRAFKVALDDSANVYVTGFSRQIASADISTLKYNRNGTLVWSKIYNGSGNNDDVGEDIKFDGSAYMYVTGYSSVAGTSFDFTTIKYDLNGNQVWVRNYNGPGNSEDIAVSNVIDASNFVYVTGWSVGNGTGFDFATLKYAPNGALQWSRRYNGPANGEDRPTKIVTDNLGNVYVTGYSVGVGTGFDYVTIKYNSIGDSVWVRRYNGTANGTDQANYLDVDQSGNVFVTGYSAQTGTGSSDYTTIKYNSNGDSLWVVKYNGLGNGTDQARSVKVDNFGAIYVTGYSVGNGTGNDYLTIKYSTNGDSLWVQRYNVSNANDYTTAMVLDSVGNAYITGSSNGDFATIKYSPDGDVMWLQRTNYGNGDQGNDIAIDKLRYVYLVGEGIGGQRDNITYKYSQQTTVKVLIEGFYDPVLGKMIRDTVRVYLRSSISPYPIADSAIYRLDTIGTGYYRLHEAPYGEYYIVLKHRNSIETWSAATYPFSTMTYDFTTAACKSYGCNQILKGSKYCIFSGDVNQDGTIDGFDLGMVDDAAFIGLGGYVKTDLDGNFFVDALDLAICDNNVYRYISKITPP